MLFAQLVTLAQSGAPLLIDGETGTGKDITAEAIHRSSPRADGPFVVFDCGAVSHNLIEAELFGYEKGAFTGADKARDGLAVSADQGTLVLDEIGELPLDLQPKLLRLVEKKEVRRVGATSSRAVDVRIIACTHRSLRGEVKAGRFREDLYYRLSALRVRLPALRERLEDLPGLVDQLMAEQGSSQVFAGLGSNDRAMLLSHRWPGNVRELRNVVERLLAFPAMSPLDAESSPHLSPLVDGPTCEMPLLSVARIRAHDQFERGYLTELMKRTQDSIAEGARVAGVSRQFIQRLMRKYGMR